MLNLIIYYWSKILSNTGIVRSNIGIKTSIEKKVTKESNI